MSFLEYLKEVTTASDIASVPTPLGLARNLDGLNDPEDLEDLLYVYLAYKDSENFTELVQALIDEFYEFESDADEPEIYNIDDLTEIVIDLLENDIEPEEILDVLDLDDDLTEYTEEEYYEFLDYLEGFFEEVQDSELLDDLELAERVSNKFTSRAFNKKRRKFFTKSRTQFRITKPKRKRAARLNKVARKRYYRKNKVKLKRYNQQYRKAVKSGKHLKKVRRGS